MEIKGTSLYKLFLKYLAMFFLFTILLIVMLLSTFFIGLASGFILPANYAEVAVEQMKDEIVQSGEFDAALVPYPCTYVLMDENGTVIDSDMTEEKIEKVKMTLEKTDLYLGERYQAVKCGESVCIVAYDMYAHFTSPALNKWLPKPEILAAILFFMGFLAIAIMIAVSFGRKLKTELVPIIEAADAIKKQELQFDYKTTQIREFNTVLDSIKDMGEALEASLKQQWSQQQRQKMQISAITHDIKTPLTIIKGNTELLQESGICTEDKELLQYIHMSTDKIEKYLGLLMEAAEAENADELKKENFSVKDCILEIEMQAKARCKAKNVTLVLRKENLPESFFGDMELIVRAVSNILDNAVEYTPVQGEIQLIITGYEDKLRFTIIDSGRGFSKKSMECGAEQFYTECKERSGKHYGLGLFIAKMVAMKHNGELLLANRQEASGAVVTLEMAHSESVSLELDENYRIG